MKLWSIQFWPSIHRDSPAGERFPPRRQSILADSVICRISSANSRSFQPRLKLLGCAPSPAAVVRSPSRAVSKLEGSYAAAYANRIVRGGGEHDTAAVDVSLRDIAEVDVVEIHGVVRRAGDAVVAIAETIEEVRGRAARALENIGRIAGTAPQGRIALAADDGLLRVSLAGHEDITGGVLQVIDFDAAEHTAGLIEPHIEVVGSAGGEGNRVRLGAADIVGGRSIIAESVVRTGCTDLGNATRFSADPLDVGVHIAGLLGDLQAVAVIDVHREVRAVGTLDTRDAADIEHIAGIK